MLSCFAITNRGQFADYNACAYGRSRRVGEPFCATIKLFSNEFTIYVITSVKLLVAFSVEARKHISKTSMQK